MKEEHAKASCVAASVDEISFRLYWNDEYHWYSGGFIHESYVYSVCVARNDDRSLGTPDIAQSWNFELFDLLTLSELFLPLPASTTSIF